MAPAEDNTKEMTEQIKEVSEDEELKSMMSGKSGREEIKPFEKFPLWMILITIIFKIAVYGVGAYLMFLVFGTIGTILYLLYCLIFIEIHVMRRSCTLCYYYGKFCAFGTGKVCALFFKKKGFPNEFAERKIQMHDLLPDFLVFLIPAAAGVFSIATKGFDWLILGLIIAALVLSFVGNMLIRTKMTCKYCKQGVDFGCPAAEMFAKKK